MTLFEYVKQQVSIVDVVSRYTTLRPLGQYLKGVCPFHQERTPSFTVTPSRNIFYCFGCQQGGDSVAFIARAEHCTPLQAALYIVDRHKLNPPAELLMAKDDRADEHRQQYDMHYRVCDLVAQWGIRQLQTGHAAQAYIQKRGLTDTTINRFLVGYFPQGSIALKKFIAWCARQSVLVADLQQSGIIKVGANGVLYSPFEDRILFPITDNAGRISAFGGRIYREQDDRPKYYNLHDHPCFHKQKTLYGLEQARKAIQTTQEVVIVEGYMDVLALSQMGILQSVATLGTACSKDHLLLIKRFANRAVVFYDGDSAGIQATIRLIEQSWNIGIDIFVAQVQAHKDPADLLVEKGDAALCITQAQDAITFSFNHLLNHKIASDQDRIVLAKKMYQLIGRCTDAFKRHVLLGKAATLSGVSLEVFMGLVDSSESPKAATASEVASASADIQSPLEEIVLGAILYEEYSVSFKELEVLQPFYRDVHQILLLMSAGMNPHIDDAERVEQERYRLVALAARQGAVSAKSIIAHYVRKRWKNIIGARKQGVAAHEWAQQLHALYQQLLTEK